MTEQTLTQRLQQTALAGVHPPPRNGLDEVERIAAGLGFAVSHIDLNGCADKAGFFRLAGQALNFPAWFGNNWDALADCLGDLSWMPASGYVIIIKHTDEFRRKAKTDFSTAVELFTEATGEWAEKGVPMWFFIAH